MEAVLNAIARLLAYPLTPSVNISEAVFLVGGLLALRFNWMGLWARYRRWKRIQDAGMNMKIDPRYPTISSQRLEAEIFSMAVQAMLFLAGVIAALSPPPPPSPARPASIAGTEILLALIAVQWALAIGSMRQRRYDVIIQRMSLPSIDEQAAARAAEMLAEEHGK